VRVGHVRRARTGKSASDAGTEPAAARNADFENSRFWLKTAPTHRRKAVKKFLATFVLLAAIGASAASMEIAMAANLQVTSTPLPVEHIKIVSSKPYAEVKANVEKLGRFDDRVRAFLKNNDIEGLRAALKEIAGADGLAIHYVALHGDLLALKGQRQQLIAYYIGNVLSATEMTNVNPAAGLYAPLRVVVYANGQGGTTLEYDRPSSMFGQFKDPVIDEMGVSLDNRLLTFLTKASE
jgi:uncharacterized protein (DUF302 family)